MTGRKTKAENSEAAQGRTVTAPLIQAKVGQQVLHFQFGDVLPDGVSDDEIERLTALGLLS